MIHDDQATAHEGGGNPLMCLPLSSLTVSDEMQVRQKKLNPSFVERYRTIIRGEDDGADRLPPITVAKLKDMYFVADGFHRRRAFELEGAVAIECIVVEVKTRAEALWLAAKGNLAHGLPLTNAEKRVAFRRFIRAGKHQQAQELDNEFKMRQRPRHNMMTLREIAAAIGTSPSSARRWMMEDFRRHFNKYYNRQHEGSVGSGKLNKPDAYEGETAAMTAKDALVNLGSAIPHISTGDDLIALTQGLAATIRQFTEAHGEEVLSELVGKEREGEAWMYRLPEDFGVYEDDEHSDF